MSAKGRLAVLLALAVAPPIALGFANSIGLGHNAAYALAFAAVSLALMAVGVAILHRRQEVGGAGTLVAAETAAYFSLRLTDSSFARFVVLAGASTLLIAGAVSLWRRQRKPAAAFTIALAMIALALTALEALVEYNMRDLSWPLTGWR